MILLRLLVMRSTSHLSGLNDICQVLSQFCRASMSSWSLVASASVLMGLYRRQSSANILALMRHKVACRLCKREKAGDQGQCLGGCQKSLYIVQSVYLRGLIPGSDRRESLQSTTEYYFSLQSGGVSGEDVGGELYRRPLRSPEVWHLSVGPYQGRLQGLVQ